MLRVVACPVAGACYVEGEPFVCVLRVVAFAFVGTYVRLGVYCARTEVLGG